MINRNNQINEVEIPADRDCAMQEGEQMHEVNCCCTPHKVLTNRQKFYPDGQPLLSLNSHNESKRQQNKCPFVIYTLCSELKNNMGNALVDTRSQISLVAEDVLTRGLQFEPQTIQIYGITGSVMETRDQIDLSIGETSPHTFMVVQELPMDCDILVRQDWLERFGYQFQIQDLGITLPAYSETLVRIPTKEKGTRLIESEELQEKGTRLIESEELQENIFCASSVVECVDASFVCLIINCNPIEKNLNTFPQAQELPKCSGKFVENNSRKHNARNQTLQAQLRLAHLKEG
jgi:hypothetical protein